MQNRFAASLALCVASTLAAQQTMPDMPGMNSAVQHDANPSRAAEKAKAKSGTSADAPSATQDVNRDRGSQRPKQGQTSHGDSDRGLTTLTSKGIADKSDQQSLEIPVQELQEPEALEFRTGENLPAPELLGEVLKRDPMTVEQFIALADRDNPTLSEAQRRIDRSEQQARQVSLPPNPTVGYNGDHIRGGEYHGGEQGAFISQDFVLGHKLALRRNVYRAESEMNQYVLEVQRTRVHNDVAQAFFHALAAQQSVVIHERLLRIALDAMTNTHELNRVGQADAAAILSAEVAAEQARVDFLTAQRTFLSQYARLSTLAGQQQLAVHPLQGALVDPPSFDPEDYVSRSLDESPLVKQAKANVQLNQSKLNSAERERVPDLNVTAGEWYSGEQLNSGAKAGWESFVQAGVQVPLWNRNQGNIEGAKSLLQSSYKQVERAKLWTRNQSEPLAQQYETARFAAERYRTQMLPRARRAYQLQVTKYQQMALDYPAVLAAQHLLFTLQLAYTGALDQEWRAAIALQNYGLMNGLDAPAKEGSDSPDLNLPTASGTVP